MRSRATNTLALAMPFMALFAFSAPVVAAASLPTSPGIKKELLVYWDGKKHTADRLPEELTPGTRAVIDSWRGWAEGADFSVYVDRDERVLIFSAKTQNRARKQARLALEVLESFDAWLPRPTGAAVPASAATEEPLNLILLFDLRQPEEARAVMQKLVKGDSRLEAWAQGADVAGGFVLPDCLAGVWVEAGTDSDAWRSDNELVHRLTLMLLRQHFGVQPGWLAQGIAWYIESEVLQKIFCFTRRNGFVGSLEHSDWDKPLRFEFRRRADKPIAIEECAALDGAQFDSEAAYKAWGMAAYFARHRREALAPILTDLAAHYQENRKVSRADGSWELVPGYRVGPVVQRHIFERHAGETFLDDVSAFFAKGRTYKP